MNEESVDVSDHLVVKGDWVLIANNRPDDSSPSREHRYCLIWVSDSPLNDNLMTGCLRLGQQKFIVKDLVIDFKSEPSPGFLLDSSSGFGFETPELRTSTVEKVIWEIERLSRL